MKRKLVISILCGIFSIIFIFALFNMVKELRDYKKAEDTYKDIQEQYVIPDTEQTDDSEETTTGSEDTEPSEETVPIKIDFLALLNNNEDIVGWIYAPDTAINYPVVKGKDNNEYLRHDLYGNYIVSGTVFADYRNDTVGIDSNYVIYGHNMKDGTMFSSISKYKEQSYYDSHPIMYYLTPDKAYKIELLAGYVTPRDSEIYTQSFGTEEPLDGFMDKAIKKSTFKSNAEYISGDKLITLSTCSYEYSDARYVIIGKLNIIE